MSDDKVARAVVWTIVVVALLALGASVWLGGVVTNLILGGG